MYKHLLAILLAALSIVACQEADHDILFWGSKTALQVTDDGTPGKSAEKPLSAKIMVQSTDNGQSWQDVSNGLPKGADASSLFAIDKKVYIQGEGGVFSSSDAITPPDWKKEILPDVKVTRIFPGQSGLYAYGLGCGFFLNTQASGIWIPINSNFKGKAVNTFMEALDGSLYIGSDNGIFKSVDGFKTWTHVFEGDLIYKLIEGDGLLMAEGTKGLLRSVDHGEHWETVNAKAGRAIATDLISGGIAAIFIQSKEASTPLNEYGMKNNLLASFDSGKTWEHLDDQFPSVRDIYDIKQAGDYLLCSLDSGIYRSHDQGKTWELVYPAIQKERFELVVSGKTIIAIIVRGGC